MKAIRRFKAEQRENVIYSFKMSFWPLKVHQYGYDSRLTVLSVDGDMEKLQLLYAASGGTDWHDHSGTLFGDFY